MFKPAAAFSGFSVDDVSKAKAFYTEVLGLEVTSTPMGLHLHLPGSGAKVFVYPKGPDHKPAAYTMLNLVVDDIEQAVEALQNEGVTFEHYDYTDDKGIARGIAHNTGPDIAWFKDPAGNLLAILKEAEQ